MANPDSAAANNIRRNAEGSTDKAGVPSAPPRHAGGNEYGATFFGLLRNVDRPARDRHLRDDRPEGRGGPTAAAAPPFAGTQAAPRVTYGLDLQQMRDNRINNATVAGGLDSMVLDQHERVTEVGPFVQLIWSPVPSLTLSAGGRYDW